MSAVEKGEKVADEDPFFTDEGTDEAKNVECADKAVSADGAE